MTFVRTVLGDIDPTDLGVTYAHEHVVIAGGRLVEMGPDFRLDDVARISAELAAARDLGLRSVIDAMPADCGRDVLGLAEVSRRSGVAVVAPTGLHVDRFYDERHWSGRASAEQLAELFVADIDRGIDAYDYGGPIVERTGHRAGVIKVGGSGQFPSPRDARVFEAAAVAQRLTGCPILTHCEEGRKGPEQVALLTARGARPDRIALSHVDKVVDRGYHREMAASGAFLEYDQAFRWQDGPNGTLQLIEWMVEDGLGDHVLLGLDAARQGYWSAYGGGPGMAYLVGDFSTRMRERGLDAATLETFFVRNPAAAFSFVVDAP